VSVIDPKAAQLVTLIIAIETHLKFKGKFRLTRTATPKNMLALATAHTGKTYKRGKLADALADLKEVRDERQGIAQQIG
jgi:hypothetical protein